MATSDKLLDYAHEHPQAKAPEIAAHFGYSASGVRGMLSKARRAKAGDHVVGGGEMVGNVIYIDRPTLEDEPSHPTIESLNDSVQWQEIRAHLLATKTTITVMHPCDMHQPFVDPIALELWYALAKLVQPDIVVRGSDEDDLPTISFWASEGAEEPEIGDWLDKMYGNRRQHTRRIKQIVPRAIQINIEGNHGWPRAVKWINKNARQSKTTITRQYIQNIRCEGNVLFIGFKESIRISNLVVMHGRYYGPNAAKKTIESRAASVSIMAGHIHDWRMATAMNDKTPVTCVISGCLCLIPQHHNDTEEDEYCTWQHSTAVATIDVQSGIVDIKNVVFYRYGDRSWFVWDGKVYTYMQAGDQQARLRKAG